MDRADWEENIDNGLSGELEGLTYKDMVKIIRKNIGPK